MRKINSQPGSIVWLLTPVLVGIISILGCGGDSSETSEVEDSGETEVVEPVAQTPRPSPPKDRDGGLGPLPGLAQVDDPHAKPRDQEGDQRTSLADLVNQETEVQSPEQLGIQVFSDEKLAAAGIRKIEGKHLILYTDLPPAPDVDELPKVFALAIPQWCEYFGVDPARVAKWQMTGFIMKDKARFVATETLFPTLPLFAHGYQQGHYLWVYEQPSPYFRRHLLLHEGTHGFMNLLLGGTGPPWYAEGIAELLGTHRWEDGKLQLRVMPQTREEVPYWGRIRIIQDKYAEGGGMRLTDVLQFGPRAHLEVEPYAWSWASATFLDGDPRYRDRFRGALAHVKLPWPKFNERILKEYSADWPAISEQWELFVAGCDYGYDIGRNAIDFKPGKPLTSGSVEVELKADRGWQTTGVQLQAGVPYKIDTAGRFQIAKTDKPWMSEAGGVTIVYENGQPLGRLLAALHDDFQGDADKPTSLLKPASIGTGRTLKLKTPGTLYLRINDSPAKLGDNQGVLRVRIAPVR